ncbi:MAG: caspase family protein [Saprospiraceae bacterium]|nr:caspase family protein [Saprospiraceae bacterium]
MIGANYLLVIAIDNYEDSAFSSLNNAKLDAEKFVAVMREKYGFILFKTLYLMVKPIEKYCEASLITYQLLTVSDNIIIYFAGHGAINPKTKKGYWIPSDATNSVGDYIPNSTIIDAVEGIEAQHILLISDSCFAGTFLTQTREKADNHYSKLAEQKSRWLLRQEEKKTVSDGQPGVGSPFQFP